MLWETIFGILAVLLGIYQIFNSYKYIKTIQKVGNKTTSYFVGYAVWYSFFFGLLILILGIALIFFKGVL